MNDITITYKIGKKDYQHFIKYCRLHTSQGKTLRYGLKIWFLLIALFMVYNYDEQGVVNKIGYFIFVMGTMLLLNLTLFWLFNKILEWNFYKPDKQKGVICEHTITISDDWIIESTEVNEDRKKWNGIYKLVEDDEYYYIFLTPQIGHFIPKKAFHTKNDAEMFWKKVNINYNKNIST
ncbi:MAG: YcxB family protein [Bacteroidota bacterium]